MSNQDHDVLRGLATRWMELASLPVMAERRRQWTALKDLRAERPMVLFETWTLENYVAEDELACTDAELRRVEKGMRAHIRQAEEIGDDIVVEPFLRIYWDIERSDFGVPLVPEHAQDAEGGNVGYHFNYPIRTPEDIDRLRPRTFRVDRAKTIRRAERLSDIFGDILPVVLHGTGSHWAALTQDLFKLIGNDNLLIWTYDAPDALHRLMAYLRDDRLAYFGWLEREGLLGLNSTGWELVGSGSPGYITSLPQPDYAGHGPPARHLGLDGVAGDDDDLPAHVRPLLPALHGRREPAVRADLLRLLRAGARPLGEDHRGHPERARRLHLAVVRPARHRGEAGAQLHLLAQTQSRAHQRVEPGLGRSARGPG